MPTGVAIKTNDYYIINIGKLNTNLALYVVCCVYIQKRRLQLDSSVLTEFQDGEEEGERNGRGRETLISNPVSYTHLDVYKRQVRVI